MTTLNETTNFTDTECLRLNGTLSAERIERLIARSNALSTIEDRLQDALHPAIVSLLEADSEGTRESAERELWAAFSKLETLAQ